MPARQGTGIGHPSAHMKTTEQLHRELMETTRTLEQLLDRAADLPGGRPGGLAQWQRTTERSAQTLDDRWLRVAAIGAIKSGKSTLVNALLGGDHLRRGAGVVTSIVTRVRKGATLRARLFFKSWESINREIRQALVLFPDGSGDSLDTAGFDLRNGDHRAALARGLSELSAERHIRQDARDPNSVLLAAYLQGYPQAAPFIGDTERQEELGGDQFRRHHGFVGDDAMAVYLSDVQLDIPMVEGGERIEIADCQGSDAPNPHHLAMIQDYLISAHLMIYVNSSRTGLRQADMKFISMLQQMGTLDNTLFVINCDLSEHDHLADLERVVARTREELLTLTPAPRVYAFSALYHLFCLPGAELSAKDGARLAGWRADTAMTAHVDGQYAAFEKQLRYKLEVEGFSVLAAAHIARLRNVRDGFGQWLELNARLLGDDEAAARRLRERLEEHRERMQQSQPLLKSALKGALSEIKAELKTDTDRFFDPHSGEGVKRLMEAVAHPSVDLGAYGEALQTGKFSDLLYRLLQEYRRDVDRVVAEELNPALVRFSHQAEERLARMLAEVGAPHAEMVRQALNDYRQTVGAQGGDGAASVPETVTRVDLGALRRELKLELPRAQATLDYSLQMKGEAMVHLGVDRLVHWAKGLLGRRSGSKGGDGNAGAAGAGGQRALKAALKRMRKEMEASIRSHLMNHRENIKYQYLLKLADAAGEALFNQLTAHYGMHVADLMEMDNRTRAEVPGNNDLADRLAGLTAALQDFGLHLEGQRCDLEALERSYRTST